jgi:hypothetical protein
MVIIILSGVLGLTILFLATAILHIHKLQEELISIDKEQHNQNKNVMDLMKTNIQHQEMLLQHIEILKYLVEQDPALGKTKLPYFGTIGRA